MAAAGAPIRTIQEWMGHRDYKTTSIYADYAPDPLGGARFAAKAFGQPGVDEPAAPTELRSEPGSTRGVLSARGRRLT